MQINVFQRTLSNEAQECNVDLANEPVLTETMQRVREETLEYATVEWIELAPELVKGLENVLRDLPTGITLGDALNSRPSVTTPRASAPPTAGGSASLAAPPEPLRAASTPVAFRPPHTSVSPRVHFSPAPTKTAIDPNRPVSSNLRARATFAGTGSGTPNSESSTTLSRPSPRLVDPPAASSVAGRAAIPAAASVAVPTAVPATVSGPVPTAVKKNKAGSKAPKKVVRPEGWATVRYHSFLVSPCPV